MADAAREFLAIVGNVSLATRSPIVERAAPAVRVVVRGVVIRLHAARSALEDATVRMLRYFADATAASKVEEAPEPEVFSGSQTRAKRSSAPRARHVPSARR